MMLAISRGKLGQEIGDGISMRKHCTVCEIYFALSAEVVRCPCCKNLLRCPLRSSKGYA